MYRYDVVLRVLCMCVCVCVQVLLDLASLIFEEQQCLEVLLRKIAGTILSFMQAQACTVFIADEDSMVSVHTHTQIKLAYTSVCNTRHAFGLQTIQMIFVWHR